MMMKPKKRMKNLKSHQMKNKIAYIIVFLGTILTQAQIYQGAVNQPDKNGIYTILLSPQIRSLSDNNIDNIRLYDNENQEVPYVVSDKKSTVLEENNTVLSIISSNVTPQKKSIYIFENTNQEKIENIYLKINNVEVEKSYTIKGSNDQKQWFGLVNQRFLNDITNEKSAEVTKTIDLPVSNYRFYAIEFDDVKSVPIKINAIGTSKTEVHSLQTEMISLKNAVYHIDNQSKKTIIQVTFDKPQVTDFVNFTIVAPEMYQRSAVLKVKRNYTVGKRTESHWEILETFSLNSNTPNKIPITSIFEKEFRIEIENFDSPSLSIQNIDFQQKPVYLTAQLQQDKSYVLRAGKLKLGTPVYDLSYFKDDLEKPVKMLFVSDLQIISQSKSAINSPDVFLKKPWFMWLCIVIGGVLILYFSIQLLKDMKK